MSRERKRTASSQKPLKPSSPSPETEHGGGGPTDRGAGEGDIGPREGLTGIRSTRHPIPGDPVGDTEIPEGTV